MMSEGIPINRCLNKPVKFWGLLFTGLVSGALVGFLVLIKFDFTIAIIGSVIGYIAGSSISPYWAKGNIQRLCYWNLPTWLFTRSKYIPWSSDRKFFS